MESAPESYRFEQRSELPGVTCAEVWKRVASWEGVNDELGPWVYMSHPGEFPRVDDVPADGRSHFTSVLLLLGVVPVERHRLALREVVREQFFDEVSSNLTMRIWSHRRDVRDIPNGVEVTDQCSFTPRSPLLGPPLLWLYQRIFRRRHHRLRAYFAGRGA